MCEPKTQFDKSFLQLEIDGQFFWSSKIILKTEFVIGFVDIIFGRNTIIENQQMSEMSNENR